MVGTWMPRSIAAVGPATVAQLGDSFSPALYGSSGVLGSLAANPTMPLVMPEAWRTRPATRGAAGSTETASRFSGAIWPPRLA